MENNYKSVLFIEDNEADQLIARKIMQITGFAKDVTIKTCEQSTLDFLTARNQMMQLPDIIFFDARAHKTEGLHLLNIFKELPASIKQNCKIVILSDSDNREEIRSLGDVSQIKKIIPKPLTVDTILGLDI